MSATLPPAPQARFLDARHAVLRALLQWIETQPDAATVADEVGALINAASQIRDMQPLLAGEPK